MISLNFNKIKIFLLIVAVIPYLYSCGIYRKVDAKDYPAPSQKKELKKILKKAEE